MKEPAKLLIAIAAPEAELTALRTQARTQPQSAPDTRPDRHDERGQRLRRIAR